MIDHERLVTFGYIGTVSYFVFVGFMVAVWKRADRKVRIFTAAVSVFYGAVALVYWKYIV